MKHLQGVFVYAQMLNSPQEPEINDIEALLNTSFSIYIPANEAVILPDSLNRVRSILPSNATTEQLQIALRSKKPTCAGIVATFDGVFARIITKISAVAVLQYVNYVNKKAINKIKHALAA